MNTLVRIGLVELAFGALLGWTIAVQVSKPEVLRRAGIVSPRRLLQAHLDYIIMGLILIAVGLAVPGLPSWIAAMVVIGTLLNPTLFLPVAFNENLASTLTYRAVTAASFLATSVGLTAAAFA